MSDPRPDKPVEPTELDHTPDKAPAGRPPPRPSSPKRSERSCSCSECQHGAVRRQTSAPATTARHGRRLHRAWLARRRHHRDRGRLRVRPDLGRPLQPGGDPRPRRRRPLPVAQRPALHHRPDRRRPCRTTLVVLDRPVRPRGLAAAPRRTAASRATATASSRPGGFGLGAAIIVEVLFTALFVIVILGVTHATRGTRTSPVSRSASTLALIHLAIIPIDNASVNPARSIASAIYGGR